MRGTVKELWRWDQQTRSPEEDGLEQTDEIVFLFFGKIREKVQTALVGEGEDGIPLKAKQEGNGNKARG